MKIAQTYRGGISACEETIRPALPATRAVQTPRAQQQARLCQLGLLIFFFFLFLSSLFCKQIVFLIMFLYLPKLLIGPLEAFLLGPKCNKLLCSQTHTFSLLHKQGVIASQGYWLGEGRPDLREDVSVLLGACGWWPQRKGGSGSQEAKMESDTV